MMRGSAWQPLRHLTIVACALVGCATGLMLPATAGAAQSVYWATADGLVVASGAGEASGGTITKLFAPPSEAEPLAEVDGVALDPAAGKVYWGDEGEGTVTVAGIGGESEGAPQGLYKGQGGPYGLVVDPAAGKVYWADYESGEIMEAGLGGEAAGETPTVLYKEQEEPEDVAIDPAAGKIYWTEDEALMVGGLGGEAAHEAPKPLYRERNYLFGLAIDPVNGEIYWASSAGRVMAGGLGGEEAHETAQTLYEAPVPVGVAVDPATSSLYWTASGAVMVGGLGGKPAGETASVLYKSNGLGAGFLALLEAPVATGAVTVSGTAGIGRPLSCGVSGWAADMPESLLYRAPRSTTLQWLRDGAAIAGATSSVLTPSEAGTYSCEASAANAAGVTTETSSGVVVPAEPSATITMPASGGAYVQATSVATSFTCADGAGGPGIASCEDSTGTVTASGGAGHLDTSTLGAHTYTVTATSKDGETASASISYTVVAATPLPLPAPEVQLVALAKRVRDGKVAVRLSCRSGGAACAGRLTLTTQLKRRGRAAKRRGGHGTKKRRGRSARRQGKSKTTTLTLARASYRVAAGTSETIDLPISPHVLKELGSEKSVRVKLTIELVGGKSLTRTERLKSKTHGRSSVRGTHSHQGGASRGKK